MYVVDYLHKQALQHPDKIALVDVASGRTVSYRQFNERASRFAEYLLGACRLQPGARVAVLAHNSSDYLELLYGCAKAGMVMVCLNWRLAPAELLPILRDADPAVLVYGPPFADSVRTLRAQLPQMQAWRCIVVGAAGDGAAPGYESCLAGASGQVIEMPPRGMDEVWHLLYTSGTTGTPKGVMQTYGMVFFNAVNCMLATGLSGRDVLLNVLPFFHTGGLNLYTNPVLHAGGTVHIMQQFDAGATIELLDSSVTLFLGVPAVYLLMSQHPAFEAAQFRAMRHWSAGGSPVAHSLLERYQAKGITICFGFGMTETGPTVFICDPDTARRKVGSIGRPVGSMRTRVVLADGSDAGPGQRGELYINGPGVTPGYWKLPQASAEAIVDGWLRSGDIAYFDADGDYYIVDRAKDMYISGAENVYPAEVENVLFQMVQIADAAVIGVADEKWGDVGAAIVVLKAGQPLAPQELQAFCRSRLSGYKVPKHVVFLDALPRTPSGKLEKHKLRSQFADLGEHERNAR
ncbi:acyl-CoA synthetase [Janthinobacterium fluminis]|uniref:Long-chain fatty acid--CoA ligase n=1 Tax=Janthinobacterium fluminis TaxID=2987524 RepID=A0ABT5JYQ6_9BURK|nr:long-chain fatty acid--CoA ligase [Janthinobacterium fluminis]MDC8757181.1 long-chain fatty acid--CoA ligase [Janthinobacterium fluminis]